MGEELRRLGRFLVDPELLENQKYKEANLAVFSKMIPLRLERDYFRPKVEIVAESDLFEPIPRGQVIPEYLIQIETIYGPLDTKWYHVKAVLRELSPDEQPLIFI